MELARDFKFSKTADGYILEKYTGSEESICIPRSVVAIGRKCFQLCESLSEVTFEDEAHLPWKCMHREPIPESICALERCWAHEAASRPSFAEICELLKENMHVLLHETAPERLQAFRVKYFK